MDEKTSTGTAHTHGPGCLYCNTVKPLLENMWSDMTRNHFRNSRVEFLKGIRSLIDDRIAHLSRDEQKGTRVTVE